MTRATVKPGICGFTAKIEACMDGDCCKIAIESNCPAIQRLCKELGPLDPFREITYRGEGPRTLQLASMVLPHAACAVPPAILKTIEVAAGLALPAEVNVTIEKAEE
ncbi:MAG TPA: hypothetical protein P5137_00290 [Candidatus Brocadiia bacterium]|nr:hypothetical protein [Candidatus Brocadiia bacterium]